MPECITPFTTENKRGQKIPVPCGKCLNCKKRLVSEWSFRLMQEDKISSSSYFITLTYDRENCPLSKNGYMDLQKSAIQNFFKRLRYYNESASNIKYFAVGEYGGRYKRPHYHILLFNAPLELIVGEKHARMVKNGLLELDGEKPFKCEAWKYGHITVGKVGEASVGYTCKYMLKDFKHMHRNDDRQPHFRLMSKKLGINYLTPKMVRWHGADLENRMFCNVGDKKCTMPRYYKKKLFVLLYEDEIERTRMQKDIGITVRFRMIREKGERIRRQYKDRSVYSWDKVQSDIQSFKTLDYLVSCRDKH